VVQNLFWKCLSSTKIIFENQWNINNWVLEKDIGRQMVKKMDQVKKT
jgi:hypothetical protein